jgi:hypothetical protein
LPGSLPRGLCRSGNQGFAVRQRRAVGLAGPAIWRERPAVCPAAIRQSRQWSGSQGFAGSALQ